MLVWIRHVVLCLFLVGCEVPLPDETSKELGELSQFAASALGAPAQVQRTAQAQAQENQKLCRYLSGGSFPLGQAPNRIEVSMLASAQEETGQLLLAYLEALNEASRGETIAELTDAREGLITSISAFETQATGETRISPVVEAVGTLISRAGESRRQIRIRSIMDETSDAMDVLSFLVERDVAEAIGETEEAIDVWDRSARCLLRVTRSRPNAIEVLQMLDAQRREFNGQLVVIQRGPQTMIRLAEAHLLASDAEIEFEQALSVVTSIINETRALVDAVEGI